MPGERGERDPQRRREGSEQEPMPVKFGQRGHQRLRDRKAVEVQAIRVVARGQKRDPRELGEPDKDVDVGHWDTRQDISPRTSTASRAGKAARNTRSARAT